MVFLRATQAVAAAVAIQPVLAAGLDIIRGARIRDAGHGGQVQLSKSTTALVEDILLDGLSLRDLGAYRLKNMPSPERIFQLIIPDLPSDFDSSGRWIRASERKGGC